MKVTTANGNQHETQQTNFSFLSSNVLLPGRRQQLQLQYKSTV